MAGVRIQRDIGDDAQLGKTVFPGARMAREPILPVYGPRQRRRFGEGSITGNSASAGTPEPDRPFRRIQQMIDTLPDDAGHGRHHSRTFFAIEYENRIDQIVGGQPVLAHQAAAGRHASCGAGGW